MWHTTPGTFGSSKSLTHTLSSGDSSRKVVLMHPRSAAFARGAHDSAAATSTRTNRPGIFIVPPGRAVGPPHRGGSNRHAGERRAEDDTLPAARATAPRAPPLPAQTAPKRTRLGHIPECAAASRLRDVIN